MFVKRKKNNKAKFQDNPMLKKKIKEKIDKKKGLS
jgi:hypothetical protein